MSDIGLDKRIDRDDLALPVGTLGGEVGDYIALLKPRVMSLVIFTALVGMVAAAVTAPIVSTSHPLLSAIALLCIAVGAGASGALNMWYDADIDARMARTAARPVPRGSVSPEQALAFGMVLSVLSVLCLGLVSNWVAAGLLAFTIFFYAVIYTMWLKRRTAQNIVIGGAAGAFPPMVAWAAMTGGVSVESIVLFALIFMWTPPHFWALALYRARDYERVGVPMLPVVAGQAETRRQILIYSALLAPTGLAPWFIGLAGPVYLVVAAVMGGYLFRLALDVFADRAEEGVAAMRDADDRAKKLFVFTIYYLFALFAVLLIELTLTLAVRWWGA